MNGHDNKKARRLTALTVFALAGALTLGGVALADHHGRHRAPHGGHGLDIPGSMLGHLRHMAHQLELTDDQKEEMHRIVKSNMSGELGERIEAMREAHRELASVLHDVDSTEGEVIAASAGVASTLERLALVQHGMIRELQGMLTEEQKGQLDELTFERPPRPPRGPKGPRAPGAPSWTAPEEPVDG